jgi:hypothetical protein
MYFKQDAVVSRTGGKMTKSFNIKVELRIWVPKLQDYHYGAIEAAGLTLARIITRPDHQTLVVPLNAKIQNAAEIVIAKTELTKATQTLHSSALLERLWLEVLIVVGQKFERSDIDISREIVAFCSEYGANLRVYWYDKVDLGDQGVLPS